MAKVKETSVNVLTEEKIKQKLAGYKSNYTKKVNAAKTAKERKSLENAREAYIAECREMLLKENQHQVHRRAAYKAWETIRSGKASCVPAKKETAKKTSRSSKVGIKIINK